MSDGSHSGGLADDGDAIEIYCSYGGLLFEVGICVVLHSQFMGSSGVFVATFKWWWRHDC